MTRDEKIRFAIQKYTQPDGWSFARIAEAVGENNKWVDRLVSARRLRRHSKYLRSSPHRVVLTPATVARIRDLYEGPNGYSQEAIANALDISTTAVSRAVQESAMKRHHSWKALARSAKGRGGEQARVNRLHHITPHRDEGVRIALPPWPELEAPDAPRFEDNPVVAARWARIVPRYVPTQRRSDFSDMGCAMGDL